MKTKSRNKNQAPFFYIEKPNLKSLNVNNIVTHLSESPDFTREILQAANEPEYLYWVDYKHKKRQGNLTAEEQWFLVKQFRSAASTKTPIRTQSNDFFTWVKPRSADEQLHQIDMLTGGQLFPKSHLPLGKRETYVTRGVIEEAIASSQLEGAHTTRAIAKKMILENRRARNDAEQMILNNYQAMIELERKFKKANLSMDVLFELHSILTDKTVPANEKNRLRKDSDNIVVEGQIGYETYTTHIPPKEDFLNVEIERLILYANDEIDEAFIHPLIKACFIHFWVGYLHPFTDGNGRLARALFYWYLLRNDYWAFSYIPISTVIKNSPLKYAMSYINSEQDEYDITYFLDYNLHKVIQAISDFKEYLDRQVNQNKSVELMINKSVLINDRQKQLIYYLISDNTASTTTTSYATLNEISRQTAAKDLHELEHQGLISASRRGKTILYSATKKLIDLSENTKKSDV